MAGRTRVYTDKNEILTLLDDKIEEFKVFGENTNTEIRTILQCRSPFIDNEDEALLIVQPSVNNDMSIPTHSWQI